MEARSQLVEGEHVAHRSHMHLEGPAGCGRHVGHPAVVAHDDALPGLDFGVHEILEQVAAGLLMVGFGLLEFGFHLRCDERIAVDLAVRVRQGDADFSILNHIDQGGNDEGRRRQEEG